MMSFTADLLLCFSGCAGNFFAVALCCLLHSWPVFLGANLILGCFNCLPVRRLDGGNGLYTLMAWQFNPELAERVSAVISLLFSLAVAAYGVAVALADWRHPYLLALGIWLLFSTIGSLKN